jgi:toxin ParE1/3/4
VGNGTGLKEEAAPSPGQMRLFWTGPALSDLIALHAYIARDSERVANETVARIVARAERQLSRLPESGRPGRIPKTRELILSGTPYVLPYRIVGDSIHILRVFHSARRWPDEL